MSNPTQLTKDFKRVFPKREFYRDECPDSNCGNSFITHLIGFKTLSKVCNFKAGANSSISWDRCGAFEPPEFNQSMNKCCAEKCPIMRTKE